MNSTLVLDSCDPEIDGIFESLNFLRLKKTAADFLSLPVEVLERFTGKYTSIVIYLLNIFDPGASERFLAKLSDTSVMYLLEEEMRLMLLAEFGRRIDEADDVMHLSNLLEELDRSTNESFVAREDFPLIRSSLERLIRIRHQSSNLKFSYLGSLGHQRLEGMVPMILQNRPIIIPILMIYANDELRQFLFIEVATHLPGILAVLPAGIFDLRYYAFLSSHKAVEALPDEMKERMAHLDVVYNLENALDRRIQEIRDALPGEEELRHATVNEVYVVLSSHKDFDVQNLILFELVNKRSISPGDASLLRMIFKNKVRI